MKRLNAGKLRAAGYDARQRILRVEFDSGAQIEHTGVGEEVWRRLSTAASAWSYYRDNIEEEFTSRRASAGVQKKSSPRDELFKK